MIQTNLLRHTNNTVNLEEIYQIQLNPKESKEIQILTMPQPGSSYPADILIKTGDTSS